MEGVFLYIQLRPNKNIKMKMPLCASIVWGMKHTHFPFFFPFFLFCLAMCKIFLWAYLEFMYGAL